MRTFSPNASFPMFLEFADLRREMPPSAPPSENFLREFPGMAMVRLRRGQTTATFYGGSDARAGLGIGSGLAMNPTFFRFRKGAAVLEAIRMTPAFFNTGFFYADTLGKTADGHELRQALRVPYHLPLPADRRNEQGNYRLSSDGRYFSKMDFESRPKEFVNLNTSVKMRVDDENVALDFSVDGYPGEIGRAHV